MATCTRLWVVFSACLLAGASAAGADEATDTFNSLFGEEIKRVKATPPFDDDHKLATQLLNLAEKTPTQTDLVAVLCRNAYDLTSRARAGFPLAIRAMELLAKTVPAEAAHCREKILLIRRRQYMAVRGAERIRVGEALMEMLVASSDARAQAGDYAEALKLARQAVAIAGGIRSAAMKHLQERVRQLATQEIISRQIIQLKLRLKANPKDAAARQRLIELYLVELDKPAEAAKFIDEDTDDILRTYVPLASRKIEEVAPTACMELGAW